MRSILAFILSTLAFPALILGIGIAVEGQQLELTRFTIDGGGVMRSTGGAFELSGSIGQPDPGILSSGTLELAGGFWFRLAEGDCNNDGGVNLIDYSGLEECLTGPDGGVIGGCECFDVDRSGSVDLLDFAAAQRTYTGP